MAANEVVLTVTRLPGAAPDCLSKHIVPELLGESLGWWLTENEAIEAPAGKL